MKNRWLAALLLLVGVASASPVFAQGGAGSTGSIQGEVTDDSGGVLPGVTVIVSGESMIGSRTDVTNAQGVYRFLGLPAGTYSVKFELSGFGPQTKSAIRIGIGFTATVSAKLGVKTLTDEVTVTSEAAPIDKTSTRTQVNFDQKQLDALPNARDMWSLLSTAPGIELSRFDVGGSTAGTQSTYVAYGNGGQNRPLIEGINTTEGTSAAGFYFDYGSFGEVIVGAAGNTAEMPSGGVLTNFIGKSGGNQLSGELYYEYENKDIQASNVSSDQLLRGYGNLPNSVITALGLDRAATNTLVSYKNLNASVGGPIIKDKLWAWGGLLRQDLVSYQPSSGAILDGTQFVNKLINYTGKVTYQMTQKDRFLAYMQYGIKRQPFRTDANVSNPQHVVAGSTVAQDSPSWVGKVEYNRTIGNRSFFEVRAGEFGYNFGLVNGDQTGPRIEDTLSLRVTGGGRDWLLQRRRKQASGAYTTFIDNVLGGNHQIKAGGEIQHETGLTIWKQYYTDNVVMLKQNGVPFQVRLGSPVESISGLRNYGAFVNDTFTRNRLSLNIGVRFDRYRAFLPAQERKASTFFTALLVPENKDVIDFNHIVPRLGLIYDLQGNGKTLFKANYGKYYFNPGVGLADVSNPNTSTQFCTYAWSDVNGDGLFQTGEQRALSSCSGGSINTTIDPNLKNSVTNEFSTWLERELGGNIAAKVGFVWKMDRDGYQSENPNRPASAWNIPTTVTDIGADGRAGTADDRTGIPAFALNSSVGSAAPAYISNRDGYEADYKTLEVAVNKRFSKKWSMVSSFTNTWTSE
ncbi:MAG: TonB-dependent receptor, partial [Vicinamibacteria bacterium]